MKFSNVIKTISILSMMFVFVGCSQIEEPLTPKSAAVTAPTDKPVVELSGGSTAYQVKQPSEPAFANSVASISYSTIPVLNTWTGVSSGTQNLSCGTFQGGLKAAVIGIVGNKLTVQIQKSNGSTFGYSGTGYVKALSACGNIAGSSSLLSSYYYVNIEFWATFTSGSVQFVPSITLSNGVKMYAPTITVTAKDDVYYNKQIVSGTNYNHYYQKDSPYFGGYACIPTSYMIAKKIVYSNATFSTTELVRISKAMGLQSWGTYIANAGTFAKSDIGTCNPAVQASSNVDWATTYIKDAITANRPLLAVTNLYGGHIVPIVGLKLSNNSSESTVYYIDPLVKQAGVREMRLSDFLSSMRAASSTGSHNLLKIGC
jgi:hypothetical protein